MNELYIDLNKVTKIGKVEEDISTEYLYCEYKPPIKILGLTIKKEKPSGWKRNYWASEAFYPMQNKNFFPPEILEENKELIFKEGVLKSKAYIYYVFSGNLKNTYEYFSSNENCNDRLEHILYKTKDKFHFVKLT